MNSYRDTEAYRRSCKRNLLTGEPLFPLPPMGKHREAIEAARPVNVVALKRGHRA